MVKREKRRQKICNENEERREVVREGREKRLGRCKEKKRDVAVSYTHLTLPTIYSV